MEEIVRMQMSVEIYNVIPMSVSPLYLNDISVSSFQAPELYTYMINNGNRPLIINMEDESMYRTYLPLFFQGCYDVGSIFDQVEDKNNKIFYTPGVVVHRNEYYTSPDVSHDTIDVATVLSTSNFGIINNQLHNCCRVARQKGYDSLIIAGMYTSSLYIELYRQIVNCYLFKKVMISKLLSSIGSLPSLSSSLSSLSIRSGSELNSYNNIRQNPNSLEYHQFD